MFVAAAVLLLFSTCVRAKVGWGGPCSQVNNRIDSATGSFLSDCDATTYCHENNTCAYRGCRKDEYPFGYNAVAFKDLPPRCGAGAFCPDEGDACQQQIPVGEPCQLNRDDECAPPPNGRELAGFRNVNGTVCLNYVCQYANVTLGQTCIIENRAYTAFEDGAGAFSSIFSRDNCANGLYCDGTALQCFRAKKIGEACAANKECLTYNCSNGGRCLKATSEPDHPAAWVYVTVAISGVILVVGTLTGLWFLHRRNREENQIKLENYYNEQASWKMIAYRKSIMSLHQARNSLMQLPPDATTADARRSLYDDGSSTGVHSHRGSLAHRRESSLRDTWSEAGDSDALLVPTLNRRADTAQPGRLSMLGNAL